MEISLKLIQFIYLNIKYHIDIHLILCVVNRIWNRQLTYLYIINDLCGNIDSTEFCIYCSLHCSNIFKIGLKAFNEHAFALWHNVATYTSYVKNSYGHNITLGSIYIIEYWIDKLFFRSVSVQPKMNVSCWYIYKLSSMIYVETLFLYCTEFSIKYTFYSSNIIKITMNI
jgi:hypothetical protein